MTAELAERWQRWLDRAMAQPPGEAAGGTSARGGPDLDDLAGHLAACAACRAEAEAWAGAFSALAGAARIEELPPPGFVDQVLAALPENAAGRLGLWQGLGLAAAVWMGLTLMGSLGTLFWAPAWLADVFAMAVGWGSFWLGLFGRLYSGLAGLLGYWRLLVLLHPAQAAVGALLLVAGWILYAIFRIRTQTSAALSRMEG